MRNLNASVKNIWMLTREFGELAGAGGVKDVTAQLSRAMAAWTARRVSVVLPCYGFMEPQEQGFKPLHDPFYPGEELFFEVEMNYVGQERREGVRVWYRQSERVHIYLLQSPRFTEKLDIYTYTQEEEIDDPRKAQGEGHYDFFAMNLLLQKAGIQLILQLQERPDVIHCHDGHTAVLPAIIEETPWLKSYFKTTSCIVTIHNAGIGYHQEVEDLPYAHAMTGLPLSVIMRSRLQDKFDPLVCAGLYATVNTVSENYATELQQSEDDEQTGWLGHHLLDTGTTLEGITNGVDTSEFDPTKGTEIGLAASFNPREPVSLTGKVACKEELVEMLARGVVSDDINKFGFLEKGRKSPLFTFIGRLNEQKGIDILLEAVEKLLDQDTIFQLVVLGRGVSKIENRLIALTELEQSLGRVCYLSGYDTGVANKIYAGGDFFLIPSRYEPCGLTDFISQLFGNLPIVHHVGGLVKVKDGITGFSYDEHSPDALAFAMERAIQAFSDKQKMVQMQKQAAELIDKKFTWKQVKGQYLELYKKAKQK